MTENENKVRTEENIKTAGAKKDARMLAIALGIVVLIIWAIIIAAVVRVVGLFHDAALYDNIDDLAAVQMENMSGGINFHGETYTQAQFFKDDYTDAAGLRYTESYGMQCSKYGDEAWLIAYTFDDSNTAAEYYARVVGEENYATFYTAEWHEVDTSSGRPYTTYHPIVVSGEKAYHIASDNKKLFGELKQEVIDVLNK